MLIVVAVVAAGFWICHSDSGTRWLFQQLSKLSGGSFRTVTTEGHLSGKLVLSGLRLDMNGYAIGLDRLIIDSADSEWLALKIRLSELTVGDLSIASPNTSVGKIGLPEWPDLPNVFKPVSIDVPDVDINRISMTGADGVEHQVGKMAGALRFISGVLHVDRLTVTTSSLDLTGTGSIDLTGQALKFTGTASSIADRLPWSEVTLQGSLKKEMKGSVSRGEMSLRVVDRETLVTKVSSLLEVSATRFGFQNLRFQRDGIDGTVGATGHITFDQDQPRLEVDFLFDQVSSSAAGMPYPITGEGHLAGTVNEYQGRLLLKSELPLVSHASFRGVFTGNRQSLTVTDLHASLLSGTVTGSVACGWEDRLSIAWQLMARGLNPTVINSQIEGDINAEISGRYSRPNGDDELGYVSVKLLDSMMNGLAVKGQGAARYDAGRWTIEPTELEGNGYSLKIRGNPEQDLLFSTTIDRFEHLLKNVHGGLQASGSLDLKDELRVRVTAEITSPLGYQGWSIEGGSIVAAAVPGERALTLKADLAGIKSAQWPKDSLTHAQISLAGKPVSQEFLISAESARTTVSLSGTGGWKDNGWLGSLSEFSVRDSAYGDWHLGDPAELSINPGGIITLRDFNVRGEDDQAITIDKFVSAGRDLMFGRLLWQNINIDQAARQLNALQISGGRTSGRLEIDNREAKTLTSFMDLHGVLFWQGYRVGLGQGTLRASWNGDQLSAETRLDFTEGFQLFGQIKTGEWPSLNTIPSSILADLTLYGLPVRLADRWLPDQTHLSGTVNGQTFLEWHRRSGWAGHGQADIDDGRIRYQGLEETVADEFKKAVLKWRLENLLVADLLVEMKQFGRLESHARIPVTRELFPAVVQDQSWSVKTTVSLDDLSVLDFLVPDEILDSGGRLVLRHDLAGSYDNPSSIGSFSLAEGRAYLPGTGTALYDIEATGTMADQALKINSFSMSAGQGRLRGQGSVFFDGFKPQNFRLLLKGERFQAVNLPEFHMSLTPDLEIRGRGRHVSISGDIILTDVLVRDSPISNLASNSSDLVFVDSQGDVPASATFDYDVDIHVLLGDDIRLEIIGIDSGLTGNLRIRTRQSQPFSTSGSVDFVDGRYSSYGVILNIKRGKLHYLGGPPDRPLLDVVATKTVNDVEVGVEVSGVPQAPVVTLYSNPSMSDTDILSYLVLGRPLSSEIGNNDILLTAAGAMLSQEQAASVQEKIRKGLRLDVLEFSSGNGDAEDAVITTGKYLTPDLYISLGYSLFKNTNELNLRYRLAPKWEIESSIGEESGVDLLYRFNIE